MFFSLVQSTVMSKVNRELLHSSDISLLTQNGILTRTQKTSLKGSLTSRRYTKFSALLQSNTCRCNKKEIQHAPTQQEAHSPLTTASAALLFVACASALWTAKQLRKQKLLRLKIPCSTAPAFSPWLCPQLSSIPSLFLFKSC